MIFGLCYDCVLLVKDLSLLDCPVVSPYNYNRNDFDVLEFV